MMCDVWSDLMVITVMGRSRPSWFGSGWTEKVWERKTAVVVGLGSVMGGSERSCSALFCLFPSPYSETSL